MARPGDRSQFYPRMLKEQLHQTVPIQCRLHLPDSSHQPILRAHPPSHPCSRYFSRCYESRPVRASKAQTMQATIVGQTINESGRCCLIDAKPRLGRRRHYSWRRIRLVAQGTSCTGLGECGRPVSARSSANWYRVLSVAVDRRRPNMSKYIGRSKKLPHRIVNLRMTCP